MLSLYGGDTRFFDRKMALTARINELVPDHFWTRFNWEP